MRSLLLILILVSPLAKGDVRSRAMALKAKVEKERPGYERRKQVRRDLLEHLDRMNADQNSVRRKIENISMNYKELNMALDNLSVEFDRQRKTTAAQKKRLKALLKVAYRIKRDGVLRFIVNGDNLAEMAGRARILFRTLKSNTHLARQLDERAARLAESEEKLKAARDEAQSLLSELQEQEAILTGLLTKKKVWLREINRKQTSFKTVYKEYKKVSKQVARLFSKFESKRGHAKSSFPSRRTLPLPVDSGRITKQFGRHVHPKFKTVTYSRGVEIAADQNSPVLAVEDGVVEYDGWVKGLGNVMIIHHGGGFYSLSAHLHVGMVGVGSKVRKGETIGLVGDTGGSQVPGLYFEIRENGKAVDPLMYFSPTALKELT